MNNILDAFKTFKRYSQFSLAVITKSEDKIIICTSLKPKAMLETIERQYGLGWSLGPYNRCRHHPACVVVELRRNVRLATPNETSRLVH